MRQAILITAYKNPEQLLDIINYFGNSVEFYIHIDKKSKMNVSLFSEYKNVNVYKKYKTNWGGVNHLKAVLLLVKQALLDKNNSYFHLITGQDFPVKPPNYFYENIDTQKDYIEYFPLPTERWGKSGGMLRFELYQFFDIFNAKTTMGIFILKVLSRMQKILYIRRKTLYDIFPKLYGGGTYWSLTRGSLQYVLDFTEANEKFMQRMEHTFCSEEMYIQSILLNSKRANNIVNDNLRYIDWTLGRGEPAFLDNSDFEKIISSNKIFARKFHESSSDELKKRLISLNCS